MASLLQPACDGAVASFRDRVPGIHDDALLEKPIELEIGPETLATLAGVPLVEEACRT